MCNNFIISATENRSLFFFVPCITKAAREVKLADVRLHTRSTTSEKKTLRKLVDSQNLPCVLFNGEADMLDVEVTAKICTRK
jgi:hypothetical protein